MPRTPEQKAREAAWMRARRSRMTPEERAEHLAHRRATRKPLTPEQRAAAVERLKRWVRANPGRARAIRSAATKRYAKRHPELMREVWRLSKSSRKATCRAGSLTVHQWGAIVDAFDERCCYCGRRSVLTIEHVIPLARGGQHSADNVAPACRSCNCRKQARGPLAMINVPYQGGA